MGRGSKRSVAMLGALVLVALGWGSGCASTTAPRPVSAGDISLAVPFIGADGSAVEAVIDGEGMESPIEAELELRGGVAHGFIDGVEAGADRRVVVTAYDADSAVCSSETSVDVAADLVTPIRGLSLDCAGPASRTAVTIASSSYLGR